jgi:hypothetical protein
MHFKVTGTVTQPFTFSPTDFEGFVSEQSETIDGQEYVVCEVHSKETRTDGHVLQVRKHYIPLAQAEQIVYMDKLQRKINLQAVAPLFAQFGVTINTESND